MTTRRLWCEHALLPDGLASGVLISIDGATISSVEIVAEAPADAPRMRGLTLPGMANTHSHAFHRALRSRTHHGTGDFWTWREQMYEVANRLTPANYLALARATFAEMVLAGFTCVGEFHYVHHQPDGQPYDDPNAIGLALVEAASQAGIRLTLLDTCYLRGGPNRPLSAEQLRFSDGSAAGWWQRVDRLAASVGVASQVRLGAAIHSVRAVDAPSIAVVAKHARSQGWPLHAHVSEQPAENEQAANEYGCTPTRILAQQGALSDQFTAVHATHLSAADVELYSMAGAACCACPTTERDLADGIGPAVQLRDRGVRLAIGSDQHAVIDPFEEMRAIELDERLRALRRGNFTPTELIAAATANGYRALGWPDGGRIAAGALGDLTTVAIDGVRLAGAPQESLAAAAVFAATAADVTDVIVGGTTVVRERAHATIDVGAELEASIAAVSGAPR